MIVDQTQIPKTLIIFLDIESLKTGDELENIFEEFNELVNSAGAEIVGKSISKQSKPCLLYTSPSPRDATLSRMPSSA